MFACNQQLVDELQHVVTQGVVSDVAKTCKVIKNGCIGSSKRKHLFLEYGLAKALVEVLRKVPECSRDAFVALASLANDADTVDHVARAEGLLGIIKSALFSKKDLHQAEAAGLLLKTIVQYRPGFINNIQLDADDFTFLLKSESTKISKLGASLIAWLGQTSESNSRMIFDGSMPLLTQLVYQHRWRSDEDILALATLMWLNSDTKEIFSKDDASYSEYIYREKEENDVRAICDFWILSLEGCHRKGILIPPPSDARRLRHDGTVLLSLIQTPYSSREGTNDATLTPNYKIQQELNAVMQMQNCLNSGSPYAVREASTALAIFTWLNPRRQSLLTNLIFDLVQELESDEEGFALATLVSSTGPSTSGLENSRKVLCGLLRSETSRNMLRGWLKNKRSPCFSGALRLVRHLSYVEESLYQIFRLDLHADLEDLIPFHNDAMIALINISAHGDSPLHDHCERLVRRVAPAALDENNDLAWSLLVNLSAVRNIEYKRAFLNSGISLARLVSGKGLAVLRNLASVGNDNVNLIESVLFPGITFVASGADENASLRDQCEYLANVATISDAAKTVIVNDSRVLNVVGRSLDDREAAVRLSAVQCVANVAWASSNQEDAQATSPRSPMLRLVQARVFAAASRSPLRFAGVHYSGSPTSSTSQLSGTRVSILLNSGLVDKIRRISRDDPDDFVRVTAEEVLQMVTRGNS